MMGPELGGGRRSVWSCGYGLHCRDEWIGEGDVVVGAL